MIYQDYKMHAVCTSTFDLEELVADAVHAAFAVEPSGTDLEHHCPHHRLHRRRRAEQQGVGDKTNMLLLLIILNKQC